MSPSLVISACIIFLVRCSSETVMQLREHETINTNRDENSNIRVTIEGNTIQIKNNTLIFENTINYLFDNNLIEHNFKNNDKILDILKKQNSFTYYEQNEALFVVCDLEFFDMDITIRIPLNLFYLDLENCDEADQLKYYKRKALQLERIIKANDLALTQYYIHFHKDSIFTVFTEEELVRRRMFLKYFYSSLYFSISKGNNNDRYLLYSQATAKNDSSSYSSRVGWFGEYLVHTDEDAKSVNFLQKHAINNNLYFKLLAKENSLRLNASFALNENILKQMEYPVSEQQLLDAFGKDIMIGKLKNYDLLNTFYSNDFNIYIELKSRDGTYACNNFYRFTVNSKGYLMLNYLYSIEFGSHNKERYFRKVKNQQIRHSLNGKPIEFRQMTFDHSVAGVYVDLMKAYTIKCHTRCTYVPFFAFDMVLKQH
eukprot:297293_1